MAICWNWGYDDMGNFLDLILADEPCLSDEEIQRKTQAIAPEWCRIWYVDFVHIKSNPALPVPVLLLKSNPQINDLLVKHNDLVFVIMDKTNHIWQLKNYKGRTALISPDLSEILDGSYIRTIPELVSILLEDK